MNDRPKVTAADVLNDIHETIGQARDENTKLLRKISKRLAFIEWVLLGGVAFVVCYPALLWLSNIR